MPNATVVIEPVVARHMEEAGAMWLRRDAAACAPHYLLSDLANLDDRLEAHLDGLRIAGDAAWSVCAEMLEEPGPAFAAALIALDSGVEGRIDSVVDATRASDDLARAVVSAFGWLDIDQVREPLARLIKADEPSTRRFAIAATAVHRAPLGELLDEALQDDDLALRARALQAAGELGRDELLPLVAQNLAAEDDDCRLAASWSAALLGSPPTSDLRRIMVAESPSVPFVFETVIRALPPADAAAVVDIAVCHPEHLRMGIAGVGALGNPARVPWLIDLMQDDELAPAAGAALRMIAGVDIAGDDLERDAPPGEATSDLLAGDENLPVPDRDRVLRWWSHHHSRFDIDVKHVLGRPVEFDWLVEVLRNGYQTERRSAAVELALRMPGALMFETRAPGRRQCKLLSDG